MESLVNVRSHVTLFKPEVLPFQGILNPTEYGVQKVRISDRVKSQEVISTVCR